MQQNDQQKRLLIAIVLSTVLMIVWMEFISPKPAPVVAIDAGAAPIALFDGGEAAVIAPVAVAVGDGGTAVLAEAPKAPVQIPEQTVAFDTSTQGLVFTNQGGALVQAVVKNAGDKWPQRKFVSREKDASGAFEPMNMVRRRAGLALPGSTELKGDLVLPLTAVYEVAKTADSVTFTTHTADATLEKRYSVFKDSFELRLDFAVTNRTAVPKKVVLSVAYPAWVDPKTQQTGGFFSPPPEVSQAMCRHSTAGTAFSITSPSTWFGSSSNETLVGKKEQTRQTFPGPVHFVGFDERYFLGAFFPRSAEGTSCTLFEDPAGDRAVYLDIDLGTLAPGQTVKRELGGYFGPKELKELQRVTHENSVGAMVTPVGEEPKPGSFAAVDTELTNSIDFGWWAVICRVLLEVMKLFQKGVVNWGIAIVLLTVLVKAILYPLSVKQVASMEAMKRLQPQMDELAKKYGDDKEKINMERMRLFSENKVNPFGGCLPLLVQMPVWIALYRTLLSSFELYREPLLGFWINDLTAHDPFYILPLAMGVTMFITQKMQPTMGDATQAKIMLYFMPIFFTFLMLNLPAGLTLYIFTNNLLSIAQQKWLQRKFRLQAAAGGGGPMAMAKKK